MSLLAQASPASGDVLALKEHAYPPCSNGSNAQTPLAIEIIECIAYRVAL